MAMDLGEAEARNDRADNGQQQFDHPTESESVLSRLLVSEVCEMRGWL
jgi:hypothetical protein